MTPDLLTLAAFVVALPGWRWMPGMLTTEGYRIYAVFQTVDGRWILQTSGGTVTNAQDGHDGWCRCLYDAGREREVIESVDAPRPDLDDDATGGCLLMLTRGEYRVSGRDEYRAFIRVGEIVVENAATPGFGSLGATLAEACASLALARGVWSS